MQSELRRRWIVKDADPGIVAQHVRDLRVSPLLARILTLRGLTNTGAARRYLSSSLRADLPSSFLMADMDAAVDRIVHAVKNKELIGIWGDYDVDGTTGASVLVAFLRQIGAEPIYHVPHR